jgi:hypothetical protein
MLCSVPLAIALAGTANATTIAPEGSLTIDLENYASGSPYYSEPYFVYSNTGGGQAPTFNSSNDTWNNNGVAGTMLSTSTVTIQGQRFVYQVGTLNGIDNLGINVGDLQTLVSSGVYTDGTYSQAANLVITIDGLTFAFSSVTANYFTVGNAAYQSDDFTGVMDAGTNSSTGQSFYEGVANLDLSLNQSNVAGGSTIGYTVTLNVQPEATPEPATVGILGAGLAALGMMRRRDKRRQ